MSHATQQSDHSGALIPSPFGNLAVAKGFVTHKQIREALDLQASLSQQGIQKRLGDILLERGYLLPHQVEAIIQEQEHGGEILSGYEILSKLGAGGMGAVYKARRKHDNLLVALKILPREMASDPTFIARFYREARIGLKLNHPSLVKCLDVGESQGQYFMALELIDGEDLGKGVRRRGFYLEAQALAITLSAARGIEHAHQSGLLHRDVKPSNLMLTRKGHVKVMDFGLAREAVRTDDCLTLTNAVMGTPHYIAPEQVDGRADLDGRCDMYSLGATFFHLLTGRPPFLGTRLYEILRAHATQDLPDPRTINKNISEETARLVLWMCARQRDERLPSMAQLVRELSCALGLPSAAGQPLTSAEPAPIDLSLRPALHSSATVVPQILCPRCQTQWNGDPLLAVQDQRLRCAECGLVFPAPALRASPLSIPDEIELEPEDESPASADVVVEPPAAPLQIVTADVPASALPVSVPGSLASLASPSPAIEPRDSALAKLGRTALKFLVRVKNWMAEH